MNIMSLSLNPDHTWTLTVQERIVQKPLFQTPSCPSSNSKEKKANTEDLSTPDTSFYKQKSPRKINKKQLLSERKRFFFHWKALTVHFHLIKITNKSPICILFSVCVENWIVDVCLQLLRHSGTKNKYFFSLLSYSSLQNENEENSNDMLIILILRYTQAISLRPSSVKYNECNNVFFFLNSILVFVLHYIHVINYSF